MKGSTAAGLALAAIVVSCMAVQVSAEGGKVTPLMAKPLSNFGSGAKEGLMLTVEYPPGGASEQHRHDAHVFVYVLEGSVVMQVAGAAAVTLSPGQTFYELPKDVHAVSKNASATAPARILVFMVKDKGKAPVLPAK